MVHNFVETFKNSSRNFENILHFAHRESSTVALLLILTLVNEVHFRVRGDKLDKTVAL